MAGFFESEIIQEKV